jgi:hypothetical protein
MGIQLFELSDKFINGILHLLASSTSVVLNILQNPIKVTNLIGSWYRKWLNSGVKVSWKETNFT